MNNLSKKNESERLHHCHEQGKNINQKSRAVPGKISLGHMSDYVESYESVLPAPHGKPLPLTSQLQQLHQQLLSKMVTAISNDPEYMKVVSKKAQKRKGKETDVPKAKQGDLRAHFPLKVKTKKNDDDGTPNAKKARHDEMTPMDMDDGWNFDKGMDSNDERLHSKGHSNCYGVFQDDQDDDDDDEDDAIEKMLTDSPSDNLMNNDPTTRNDYDEHPITPNEKMTKENNSDSSSASSDSSESSDNDLSEEDPSDDDHDNLDGEQNDGKSDVDDDEVEVLGMIKPPKMNKDGNKDSDPKEVQITGVKPPIRKPGRDPNDDTNYLSDEESDDDWLFNDPNDDPLDENPNQAPDDDDPMTAPDDAHKQTDTELMETEPTTSSSDKQKIQSTLNSFVNKSANPGTPKH